MNVEDLGKQLQNKRRTVQDLARFISTRTDNNPNYTVLLGAGCSITSGVRSASDLTNMWRNDLCPGISGIESQRQYLKQNCGDWYDPSREYSSLFEKKYDLQRQRRMFVEKEVSGKTPSLGYAYLTSLVTQAYFNTVFTTNFDDLVNEAFYLYSEQRPIVCAHDSSINSITVTSKRPKVIKLHGDYLFDDIKATARETESLEQNMKAKFAEFAKDYGMIVVGYSGGDRSIMDSMSTLLKSEEYFKGGMYWCLRKNSEVSEELRKLLWKEKTYFVEIDGFDELFAELYSAFNNGEVLPISTLSVTRRPGKIASRLIDDQSMFETSSEILKTAREQLIKQSKRSTLMNLILTKDQDITSNTNEKVSDDEMITQIEIQNLVASGSYRDAVDRGRAALNTKLGAKAKRNILAQIIDAHRKSGDLTTAVTVADQLISSEPYFAAHYLLKSRLLPDKKDKLDQIEAAIKANPYFVNAYYSKAEWYLEQADTSYGEAKSNAVAGAREAIKSGLALNPSLLNPCWNLLFTLLTTYEQDKHIREQECTQLISTLSAMNPESYTVLLMRVNQLSKECSDAEVQKVIDDIEHAQSHTSADQKEDLEEVRLQAIAKLKDIHRIKDVLTIARSTYDLAHNVDLAVIVAKAMRTRLGLDEEAVMLLGECLKVDFDADAATDMIQALLDLGKIGAAEEAFNKWSNRLPLAIRDVLTLGILDVKADIDGALNELSRQCAQSGKRNNTMQMYFLNRKGAYAEAEKYGRELLNTINFSLEAGVEIVNFELACKHTKSKPNANRLESLLKFTDELNIKVAIYALLDKKREMIDCIKKAIEFDKTFRYESQRWPVFEDFRKDPEFLSVYSNVLNPNPILTAVPNASTRSAA